MTDDASGAGPTDDRASHGGRPAHGRPAFQSQVRAARSEFEQQIGRARAEFEEANERINARSGRNLLVATLIGLGIGALVLGSLLIVKWAFLIFAVPLCLLGIFEFSRALQAGGRRVDVVAQLLGGAFILAAAAFADPLTHWIVTIATVFFVAIWRMIGQMAARDGRRYGDVLSDVLVTGFVPLYVAFLGSFAFLLLREDHGELWVLTVLAVVVAADTGAYASGLAFGRHAMAPRISPNKTWEGFAGAFVAAATAAILLGVFLLGLPWWAGAILGVAILLTATLGDLGESMIKRDLGIKDMSSWLPGHGGVLDRLDSILPSLATGFALFLLLSPLSGLA